MTALLVFAASFSLACVTAAAALIWVIRRSGRRGR
jgi:hypothetical protein